MTNWEQFSRRNNVIFIHFNSCDKGWQGLNCTECKKHPACHQGTCTRPWECNCNPGWGGNYCDLGKYFPLEYLASSTEFGYRKEIPELTFRAWALCRFVLTKDLSSKRHLLNLSLQIAEGTNVDLSQTNQTLVSTPCSRSTPVSSETNLLGPRLFKEWLKLILD